MRLTQATVSIGILPVRFRAVPPAWARSDEHFGTRSLYLPPGG